MTTRRMGFKLLYRLLLITSLLALIWVLGCDEDVSGPDNQPPQLDSIIVNPDSVFPGAPVELRAVVNDIEGDSIRYRWSTYDKAGTFSDTLSPVCTLVVSPVLSGGMKLKVNLEVSDGRLTEVHERWIPLMTGSTLNGTVYYTGTDLPLPAVEIELGYLGDTSSFSGNYSIMNIPPGQYTLTARKPGCDTYTAEIDIAGDQTHDIDMVCPGYTYTFEGSIHTYDDQYLENVRVTLLNNDGSLSDLSDVTDGSGHFIIENVPLGRRTFLISPTNGESYVFYEREFKYVVQSNMNVEMKVRTKRTVFVSSGINSPEKWLFEDDPTWRPWEIDNLTGCYYFNTCEMGDFGMLPMAETIFIPDSAIRLEWIGDFIFDNVVCNIAYELDGVEAPHIDLYTDDEAVTLTRVVSASGVDPYGKNFRVIFYTLARNQTQCGSVYQCRFEISYYL